MTDEMGGSRRTEPRFGELTLSLSLLAPTRTDWLKERPFLSLSHVVSLLPGDAWYVVLAWYNILQECTLARSANEQPSIYVCISWLCLYEESVTCEWMLRGNCRTLCSLSFHIHAYLVPFLLILFWIESSFRTGIKSLAMMPYFNNSAPKSVPSSKQMVNRERFLGKWMGIRVITLLDFGDGSKLKCWNKVVNL